RAAAPAAGGGPSGRHARGAFDGLERIATAPKSGSAGRASAGAMVGGARHRQPHLHALPPGAVGLPRGGAARGAAHLLGRSAALPLGGTPQLAGASLAQRHAQGGGPRPARAVSPSGRRCTGAASGLGPPPKPQLAVAGWLSAPPRAWRSARVAAAGPAGQARA